MKICAKCKQEKHESQFYKRKQTLHPYCKECCRILNTAHWRATKSVRLEKKLKSRTSIKDRNTEYVVNYLKTHPCVDCGETNVIVLEFDHRGDKHYGISNLISTNPSSLELLQREIDKCDVRCANCHRIKTTKERNYRILKFI